MYYESFGIKPKDWTKKAARPAPYDPLALTNLGRSVELALLVTDPVPNVCIAEWGLYG